jgi:hypothetical protein
MTRGGAVGGAISMSIPVACAREATAKRANRERVSVLLNGARARRDGGILNLNVFLLFSGVAPLQVNAWASRQFRAKTLLPSWIIPGPHPGKRSGARERLTCGRVERGRGACFCCEQDAYR